MNNDHDHIDDLIESNKSSSFMLGDKVVSSIGGNDWIVEDFLMGSHEILRGLSKEELRDKLT